MYFVFFFFFSSRRRHTRCGRDWSSDVCSSDLWIPFMMQRFDNEFMMRTSDAPLLKRKPSEYMREMYYSSQPMEMVDNRKALELTFEMINAPTQLLYSSDYPHWDMDLPSTIYDLPFLDMNAKRAILGGNAQRLFKLDPVMSPVKLA